MTPTFILFMFWSTFGVAVEIKNHMYQKIVHKFYRRERPQKQLRYSTANNKVFCDKDLHELSEFYFHITGI